MFRPLFIASLFVGCATPAVAQSTDESVPAVTVTGGVTLASQYRFRGVSLSDEQVAVQGTINLNHNSGFYLGVWSSSTDGFGELGGSNVEVDIYGGYRREIAEGVTADVGLLYYVYPGSTGGDFEFFEPYANVTGSIGPVTAKLGVAYAWEQNGLGSNDNLYVFNDNSLGIPSTPLTLTTHVGYSSGDSFLALNEGYLDWSLGASATFGNLTLGVAYVGTDADDAQTLAAGATPDIVDDAVVATLTASF